MKRIKLFAILVFLSAGLMFKFFAVSPPVSGQTSLAAPTGVTATDGAYSTKVGLWWDTMKGATIYRIFRNTVNDPNTATEIGTTAANFFFDLTVPQGQIHFYWVRSESGTTVSDFSQTEQGLRANGTLGGGIQPLQPPNAPPANPITAAKAYLGKTLFWDEQLSSTRTVSCGTCHSGNGGGVDKRTALERTRSMNPGLDGIFNNADDIFGSPGVIANNLDGTYNWSASFGFREQVTGRRAMPYTDSAYSPTLFWDGRATPTFRDPLTNQIVLQNGAALESQAVGPPVSSAEMAHSSRNWTEVAERVANSKPLALATNIPNGLQNWIEGRTYPELFQEAFGTSDVTPARIAMAIATHERTLFSDQTPLDQLNQGIGTLTAAEQRGLNLFNSGVTGCSACHAGNLQTDNAFHYIGVRPQNEDLGRQLVTNNANNAGEMRTPNLRNVQLRGAYFHNGRFTTLREVVDFYNRGGDFNGANKPPIIRPLGLGNGQLNDLVAFLSRPLTDVRVRDELPPFDRPTLYAESNRVPVVGGTGRAGSGGIVPLVTAIEPPLLGNPSFTVAVSSGLGNSAATLVIDASDPGVGTSIPATGSFLRQTINLQGTGNGNGWGSISIAIPNNSLLIGQTFFGRWYVVDASAANGFAVSQVFQFTIFGDSTAPNQAGFVDFDGDRKTDISIFRPSVGQWWYLRSSDSGNRVYQFGQSSDRLVPGDYTGDGKTDVAFYRPSTGEWFILRSEDSSFFSFPFGTNGDIPAPADYDGDGKTDPAVFRPSEGNWYIQTATQGTFVRQFGVSNDIPQVGDYDNDGNADIAIFRPSNGQWWINRSTAGVFATQFGSETDKPQARDYTGDGKTDVAFWRPSTGEWFILRSEDLSFFSVPFGTSGDIPAAGDYDGDGRADLTIFRPSSGTWFVNRTAQGMLIANFGLNGDRPVPASFTP
jgi:cytochrome c peroxidase